ncbi:MAG: hypothetical protein IIT36_05275 [Aeriscardovia sp.]|nr:hypothetical protein [Aeriscardovia sp.]
MPNIIFHPVTRRDAEHLAQGVGYHTLGCILRRLVYAGATPDAKPILDQLPLEKFMKTTEAWRMMDLEQLGWKWTQTLKNAE